MIYKISIGILATLLHLISVDALSNEADVGQFIAAGQPVEMSALLYDVQVDGFVAKVNVRQTFSPLQGAVEEAVYNFQIPDRGTIQSMSVTFAERTITAILKEKVEAKQIYQEAKSKGQSAALTESLRTNLFSQRIANIPAGEMVTVRLSYTVEVKYANGKFSLNLPFSSIERYRMAQQAQASVEYSGEELAGWALSPIAKSNVDQSGPQIDAIINISAGLPLQSVNTSIPAFKSLNGSDAKVSYQSNQVVDGLQVEWYLASINRPSGALFSEEKDGDNYSLLMLMPPERIEHRVSRDISFVLDTSGSMQGPAIEQAKQALNDALSRLTVDDRFQIITFNGDITTYSKQPLSADHLTVNRAKQWVSQIGASGGTEMLKPFKYLRDSLINNKRLQQVVFITDGAIDQEQLLLEEAKQLSHKARIYTVAIGQAPNTGFMRKVAMWGRGSDLHIASASSISSQMRRLFKQLGRVAMTNIKIAGDFEVYPKRVRDLHADEPLFVMVKGEDHGELVITGELADQPWEQTLEINANSKEGSGISALWAMKKIASLEDDLITSPQQGQIKQEIIDTSLEHNVISPFTSFVAVQGVPSTGSDLSVSKAERLEYPQTSLDLDRKFLLGLLALIGIVLQLQRRRSAI